MYDNKSNLFSMDNNMNTLKSMTLLFLVYATTAVAVDQPPIGIILESFSEEKSYDDEKYCNLYFSIHNNHAPGTIERIDIGVDVFDDRGKKIKLNMMSDDIQNKGDGWGADRAPIAVGQTMLRTEEVWAEEECQYIAEFKLLIDEIKNSDCSIRMLPEGVECSTLVGVQQAEEEEVP